MLIDIICFIYSYETKINSVTYHKTSFSEHIVITFISTLRDLQDIMCYGIYTYGIQNFIWNFLLLCMSPLCDNYLTYSKTAILNFSL
jgi:hypothetical protein